MTSEHNWSGHEKALAVICVDCGQPLVPMGHANRGRLDPVWVRELRARTDCTYSDDTRPAQGWATLPERFQPAPIPERYLGRYTGPILGASVTAGLMDEFPAWMDEHHHEGQPITDAGRNPALREEHTMSPMEMGRVEMTADREDFDEASRKASTVAQFATMGGKAAREELEGRGVSELVRLADEVRMAGEWHAQGARDAADLRSQIASVLRDAAEAIDPSQMAQSVLR